MSLLSALFLCLGSSKAYHAPPLIFLVFHSGKLDHDPVIGGSCLGFGIMVEVGDINERDQEVIENTGLASTSHYNQTIYALRCLNCFEIYGANGCDCHIRRCPYCQGGQPPEPIPPRKPPPAPDDNFEVGEFVYHKSFELGQVIAFSQEKVCVEFPDHGSKFIVPEFLSRDDADAYRTKLLENAGYDRTKVEHALSEVRTLRQIHESDRANIRDLENELESLRRESDKKQADSAAVHAEKLRLEHELRPLRRVLGRKSIASWIVRRIIASSNT